VFYFVLGSIARTVLHARPVVARVVSRCSGVAMVAIGAGLLVDHLIG
jgi:threonine/homoserine/homoserine lactone efflux protein